MSEEVDPRDSSASFISSPFRTSTDTHARPPLQAPQDPPNNNRSSALFSSLTSAASYLADPVRYTVSGLVRRISEDEAPTPLAKALSANFNGSLTDPTTGVYHPQQTPVMRRKSPFQPPPLTPSPWTATNAARRECKIIETGCGRRDQITGASTITITRHMASVVLPRTRRQHTLHTLLIMRCS